MKIIIQRVSSASVEVEGSITGTISNGYLLYIGISKTDTEEQCRILIDKLLQLRLFPNAETSAHFDKSIEDIEGGILVVSQFTLYGSLSKGRRPSFDEAMKPEDAEKMYTTFVTLLKQKTALTVETGIFGAHMIVTSQNDGPATFILEQ